MAMKKNSLIQINISEGPEVVFGSCVFRIDCGNKFFIWKGKEFPKCLVALKADISWKLNDKLKCPSTDRMFKLVNHIRLYRLYILQVTPLFFSETPLEILDFEKQQLHLNQNNTDCLNNIFEPHVPAWISGVKKEDSDNEIKPEPILVVPNTKKVAEIKGKPLRFESIKPAASDEILEMPDFDVSEILGTKNN